MCEGVGVDVKVLVALEEVSVALEEVSVELEVSVALLVELEVPVALEELVEPEGHFPVAISGW